MYRASLVAQMVKNLPAKWKARIQFLGQKDPLEKGVATHSSILANLMRRVDSLEKTLMLGGIGGRRRRGRQRMRWLDVLSCVRLCDPMN